MKTNFRDKNFALSLAFIVRVKATRKWPIPGKMDKVVVLEGRGGEGMMGFWHKLLVY